ncbi:MAG: response regulator [Chitinispirillaceae bacterium]|nr:response regulator [Chitinispirillaceae bacterium]
MFHCAECGKVTSYSILVVDDDQQVCKILCDLFHFEGYTVATASNGKEALESFEKMTPDLVISDIQMPVMDGFELYGILRKNYPRVKHIMMTSYDIDQYIRHIRQNNIGNILVKGYNFNLQEVASYVRSILTGEIFGLSRYFDGEVLNEISVRSYAEAKNAYRTIVGSLSDRKGFYLEIAIDELISNAIFHGVLELSGVPREEWSEDLQVPEKSAVKVTWGVDNDKIGIAIEDPKGNLKKTDVLKWLDAHRKDEDEDDDEHGRGFFLVRRLIDRLIINIDPGNRTECIILQNLKKSEKAHNKPLLIHEI